MTTPVSGALGPVRVRRFDDAEAFARRAEGFLAKREAEHNLLLGILSTLRTAPELFRHAPYRAVAEDATGSVTAVALRTPPFNVVLSRVEGPDEVITATLAALADDVVSATSDPADVPGVLAERETARRFAEEWSRRAGVEYELGLRERIFQLEHVIPPAPVSGGLRVAGADDRQLLIDWLKAFHEEALGETTTPDAAEMVDRWLAGRTRTIYVWEDGVAVSMAGAGGPTPNGIRIGPVYTPPALRRRGYASALVAAVSQAQLDSGRRFCFLFTDLANPTSNHIYQQIGYEPVGDVDEYRFRRP